MKRPILIAAALAASGVSIPSVAQTPKPGYGSPRPGKFVQALQDTIAAAAIRQNMVGSTADPVLGVLLGATASEITEVLNATHPCFGQPSSGWNTVFKIIACTTALPIPYELGEPGGRGTHEDDHSPEGFGGGGGSSGTFLGAGGWGKEDDCGDLKLEFDAQGNLIIPAMAMPVGKPVVMREEGAVRSPGFNYWFSSLGRGWNARPWMPNHPTTPAAQGFPEGSATRFTIHKANMIYPSRDWWGVWKQKPRAESGGLHCVTVTTVAYKHPQTGLIEPRHQTDLCESGYAEHVTGWPLEWADKGLEQKHFSCPMENAGGGDFDFYGVDGWNLHYHNCTWYHPRLPTPDGYAINPKATVPQHLLGDLANQLPDHLKRCYLSKKLLAAVADRLLKKATEKPGYTGPAHKPVEPQDARPGDTTINDLAAPKPPASSVPTTADPTGTPTPPQTPTPGAPPPGQAPPPGSSGPVDFGPNPGIPQPGDQTAPTNALDPLFAWLPKLDTLTIATGGAACPIWQIDLTNFASSWNYSLETHCGLMESNRALIGALMIVLFGISAALIILRA